MAGAPLPLILGATGAGVGALTSEDPLKGAAIGGALGTAAGFGAPLLGGGEAAAGTAAGTAAAGTAATGTAAGTAAAGTAAAGTAATEATKTSLEKFLGSDAFKSMMLALSGAGALSAANSRPGYPPPAFSAGIRRGVPLPPIYPR